MRESGPVVPEDRRAAAERFWYYLGCIAVGADRFAKASVEKGFGEAWSRAAQLFFAA